MRYFRGQDLNPLIYYNIDKGLDAVNLFLKVYVKDVKITSWLLKSYDFTS